MYMKSYTPSGEVRAGERRLGPGTHTEALMEEVQSSWDGKKNTKHLGLLNNLLRLILLKDIHEHKLKLSHPIIRPSPWEPMKRARRWKEGDECKV